MPAPKKPGSPLVHSVHFYDHDEALILRLRNIVTSAIDAGNSILIVATEEHRRQLTSALQGRGGDLNGLLEDGRLNLHDAREMLTKFMVQGLPDRERFLATVGDLVCRVKEAAWNAHRGVTVFGEMVALLWDDRNTVGALQLESLWNDLLNDRAFHLHCAYSREILERNADSMLIKAICEEHSHVIGHVA
jgi:MEDS: MEthanogen/methylotroph, DcmR Sensory domain